MWETTANQMIELRGNEVVQFVVDVVIERGKPQSQVN